MERKPRIQEQELDPLKKIKNCMVKYQVFDGKGNKDVGQRVYCTVVYLNKLLEWKVGTWQIVSLLDA